tara:strand:- start:2327 stop:2536 length:210 start_codon:yes stop_codon:yes gene_type:complete
MEYLSMASELNQYAIYDCNILRINLNEMVQRRASSQGKTLTDQEIDDIAVVLRRKIDWEPIFSQIDQFL